MTNVIFLDIDGVLVTNELKFLDDNKPDFDKQCIANLNNIFSNVSDLNIIISSSRRKGIGLLEFRYLFKKRGFHYSEKIIGITPLISRGYDRILRGEEINEYLINNSFDKYLIIDDDSDFLDNQNKFFIKTNYFNGLTKELSETIIKFFNKK